MNIENIIKSNKKLNTNQSLIINMLYTQQWVRDSMSSYIKDYDLSLEQFNVLRILRGNKGQPMNLNEIQERMVTRMSNTTRLIDKLIAKDLVNRNACPSNRRKIDICILPKGEVLLRKIDESIVNQEASLLSNLSSKEKEQLTYLLNKLRN
ncbi:MarR family transcriptional regulator [Flavobacteriaceae bacterium]|nr:MarR family transcriptional regulator [Flavobacteriaceae bacterium]